MKIPMEERRILIKHQAKSYQRSGKKGKSLILDQMVEATGGNRAYLARVLRSHGKRRWVRKGTVVVADAVGRYRKGRPRDYGERELEVLQKVWGNLDYACGKRLAAGMRGAMESLEVHGEIEMTEEVREKLLKMSPATMDRLLKPERERNALKGRSGTKPGTLLKSQVAVRTFAEWDEQKAGFVEIDLVGHDGGSTWGDYLQTLDVTDVHTGWSEQVAVLNKAQVWVFEALLKIRERLPFPLLGIDSDNGGEFINHHLVKYCYDEEITFTRCRPYRKNDNCFVEQKNYSIVRRAAGYGRYEGRQPLEVLNRLYDSLRLRTNYFLPSAKLIGKQRIGSRVRKFYDDPKTPYQRLLECPETPEKVKGELRLEYQGLNLAAINREIEKAQRLLVKLIHRGPVHPRPNHEWNSGFTSGKRGCPSPPAPPPQE